MKPVTPVQFFDSPEINKRLESLVDLWGLAQGWLNDNALTWAKERLAVRMLCDEFDEFTMIDGDLSYNGHSLVKVKTTGADFFQRESGFDLTAPFAFPVRKLRGDSAPETGAEALQDLRGDYSYLLAISPHGFGIVALGDLTADAIGITRSDVTIKVRNDQWNVCDSWVRASDTQPVSKLDFVSEFVGLVLGEAHAARPAAVIRKRRKVPMPRKNRAVLEALVKNKEWKKYGALVAAKPWAGLKADPEEFLENPRRALSEYKAVLSRAGHLDAQDRVEALEKAVVSSAKRQP